MKRITDVASSTQETAFVEVLSDKGTVSMSRYDDTRLLLIDVVNPQPRSAKSFYARINATKKKTDRIRRQPAKATKKIRS